MHRFSVEVRPCQYVSFWLSPSLVWPQGRPPLVRWRLRQQSAGYVEAWLLLGLTSPTHRLIKSVMFFFDQISGNLLSVIRPSTQLAEPSYSPLLLLRRLSFAIFTCLFFFSYLFFSKWVCSLSLSVAEENQDIKIHSTTSSVFACLFVCLFVYLVSGLARGSF